MLKDTTLFDLFKMNDQSPSFLEMHNSVGAKYTSQTCFSTKSAGIFYCLSYTKGRWVAWAVYKNTLKELEAIAGDNDYTIIFNNKSEYEVFIVHKYDKKFGEDTEWHNGSVLVNKKDTGMSACRYTYESFDYYLQRL